VLDRHERRERAARAFDAQRAIRLRLGSRERPAKARLGEEEPTERKRDGEEKGGEYAARGKGDGARSQKPYPTEKCSRQSLLRAP
jgi:hypothetical protein